MKPLSAVAFAATGVLLLASLCAAPTYGDAEKHYASESGIVFIAPCRDAKGDLVPAVPYAEFLRRGMDFLLCGQDTWFKGERRRDAAGNDLPPFFKHAKLGPHGHPYTEPVPDKGVVYPAGHLAIGIRAFASYYVYSGDEEALRHARRIADWNIANSTPSDWQYGSLPYSTFVNGVPGGFVDGDAVMTDKPAIMALAYLRLHRMTGEAAYLGAARRIADTMARTQLPEGNWHFRVEPRNGEVREAYTSSAIYGVMLFEALDAFLRGSGYRENRDRALQWILENPVKTMDWRGFFEDVGNAPENRTNWDCIDTVRYLLSHRDDIPRAMEIAEKLNNWIAQTFIERDHMFSPAAGVREQTVCFSIMGGHAIHWAVMMADLHRVTGDERQRWEVEQVLNFITYLLQPDNRIVIGAEHGLLHPQGAPFWYSNQFSCESMFLEILGLLPGLAPEGETHLLRTEGEVRAIRYGANTVTYTTDAAGTDVLRLAFTPLKVHCDGVALQRTEKLGDHSGWVFDEETGILHVTHGKGEVRIHE